MEVFGWEVSKLVLSQKAYMRRRWCDHKVDQVYVRLTCVGSRMPAHMAA